MEQKDWPQCARIVSHSMTGNDLSHQHWEERYEVHGDGNVQGLILRTPA